MRPNHYQCITGNVVPVLAAAKPLIGIPVLINGVPIPLIPTIPLSMKAPADKFRVLPDLLIDAPESTPPMNNLDKRLVEWGLR